MNKSVLTFFAVLAVISLAAAFRFYDIKNYPPGLFPDEAANGEDALLILNGDLRPFYPRGNGREALFFYLQAASIWFFGIGVWPMHVVSATIGVATVLAAYFATRVWFGRLAGLMAALLLATNHWHVTLSRTGFRAIQVPLFIALFTAFVGYTVLSVKRKTTPYSPPYEGGARGGLSYLYAALAGASFAGGFYTYIAYRIMVAVIAGIVVLLLLAAIHPKIGFPHFRRYGWQILVGCLATALVLTPLIWYFILNPQDFVGRAGQVSIFNPDLQREYGHGAILGTLIYSLRETVLSFFAGHGDLNWRHNVAGFPLLNPLVAILFLLGLAWFIRGFFTVAYKIMRGQEVHLGMIYAYVLLLLFGMLTPVVTTAEGMPHGLRSLGLLFPIFMLAGTAGAVVWHWLAQWHNKKIFLFAILRGAFVGLLVLGIIYDGSLYFLIARHDVEAYYAYRGDLTVVSDYLNKYHAGWTYTAQPYLVLDQFSLQAVHYLTSVAAHEYVIGDAKHPDEARHKWRQLDPAASHLTTLQPGEIMVFTQSTITDADRYARLHEPEIELITSQHNRFGQEIMRVYSPKNVSVNNPTIQNDLDAQ